METFKIEVQEFLSRTIDVEAHDIDEAVRIVNQMYTSEEIVLDYLDLSEINIIPKVLIEEKENLIKEIIEYLYQDEENHFEELDKPKDHIFLKLKKLKELIN